jgi:threonine dehydrogenase-like Zn-dependent dehydrogenase
MRMLAANLGRYPFGEIVTHRFGLDRVNEALAVAQSGEAMQVVVDPAIAPGPQSATTEGSTAS